MLMKTATLFLKVPFVFALSYLPPPPRPPPKNKKIAPKFSFNFHPHPLRRKLKAGKT